MATKIGSLFGDVSLRTAKLEKGVRDVRKRLDTLGKNMRRTGRTLSTFVTAPIVALGAKAVQSFGEQEQAEAGLRAALQASGQEVERNFQALTRLASELQKVTTTGDEAIIRLQQMGISMGLTATQAGKAARGAIGLSEATGMNLDIALRGATNALQGQFTTLQRYLPELRTVETDAEKLAIVQEAMAEGFDLAKARADTFTGGLKQLGNQIGDIMEEFGSALAPLLETVRDRIQAVADRVQNLTEGQKQLIVQIAALAAAIGPALLVLGTLASSLSSVLGLLSGGGGLVRMFGSLAAPLAALFASPLGWVVVGAGVVATLVAAFTDLQDLKSGLDQLWSSTKSAFAALIDLGRSLWERLQDLAAVFNIELPSAVQFFTDTAITALQMLKDFMDSVTRVAQNLSILLSRNQSFDLSGRQNRSFLQNTVDVVTLGGFRAAGGPVSAGQPYVVGEDGPEMFVPRASGEIVPNDQMGGGPTYNITIGPGTDMGVVAAIRNMRTEIGEIAVEAVRDDRLRSVY